MGTWLISEGADRIQGIAQRLPWTWVGKVQRTLGNPPFNSSTQGLMFIVMLSILYYVIMFWVCWGFPCLKETFILLDPKFIIWNIFCKTKPSTLNPSLEKKERKRLKRDRASEVSRNCDRGRGEAMFRIICTGTPVLCFPACMVGSNVCTTPAHACNPALGGEPRLQRQTLSQKKENPKINICNIIPLN